GGLPGPSATLYRLDTAGATWTAVPTTGTPPSGRSYASMIYDALGDRLVLFGGRVASDGGAGVPTNELWSLSLSGGATPRWAPLAGHATGRSRRAAPTAVYARAGARMIVFGGYGASARQDAYALSLGATPTWTRLPDDEGARFGHVAVYDGEGQMLVFGGRPS